MEASLKLNVKRERQLLHFILEHIKEVARREMHLLRGYPNLKEYLKTEFGYSDTAARRRMEAAILMMEVPALAFKISEGTIHLTQIGELARAINEKELGSPERVSTETKNELVETISGKTTRETQRDLAQALDIKLKEYEIQRVQKDESVRMEITISKELNEKLQACRDLASQKLQQERKVQSLASVIEVLADLYLRYRDTGTLKGSCTPTKELENVVGGETNLKSTPRELNTQRAELKPMENKTITPKTLRFIRQRDQSCRYHDPKSGRICGSTRNLQVDHKVSRWAGGENSMDNLQLFCASHNRFKFRKEMGVR